MGRQPGEYQFYKSLGICVRCHKTYAEPNKVRCAECAYKDLVRTQKTTEKSAKTKKKDMERYYELKRNGICTNCKHEKAVVGKTKCKKCIAKIRNRNNAKKDGISRSERVAYGLCYICGESIMQGKKVCERCYNTRLESVNKIMHLPGPKHWANDNKLIFRRKVN